MEKKSGRFRLKLLKQVIICALHDLMPVAELGKRHIVMESPQNNISFSLGIPLTVFHSTSPFISWYYSSKNYQFKPVHLMGYSISY